MCSERGSQGWHNWAEQNLHNDTRGQFTMRDDTVQIRLVGVNVDNRADGRGKAGLTFMTTTYVSEIDTNMADTNHNAGGYRDVRIRKDYNEGRYKSTISSNVYQYLAPVLKIQDNQANDEMDNQQHSATSNAIVEKVSIPSPLELNMSVGTNTDIRNNNPTPTGLTQYNGYSWWQGKYNYLYSGNSSYEYYQNNTSDVSEYCKLMKGNGLFIHNWLSCQGISDNSDNHKYFWFRSPRLSDSFAVTSSAYGNLGLNYASLTEKSRTAALFSF